MAKLTKLQQCLEYAGDCVVRSQEEYEEHIAKLRDIMVNGNADNTHLHTLWLYAVEAWEIQNELPSLITGIYEDIPQQS